MHKPWFKWRSYKHFDCPIGEGFARKVMKPKFVERHSFSPLIHYLKIVRRYKPKKHKTETKQRDIMYASHRDACVLSYYSHRLNGLLEKYYAEKGLSHCAIAYRALALQTEGMRRSALDFCRVRAKSVPEPIGRRLETSPSRAVRGTAHSDGGYDGSHMASA